MDTTKQLELAIVYLQEQRNTALDTVINLKIEIAALRLQYQDLETQTNMLKIEAAAKQEDKINGDLQAKHQGKRQLS